MRTLQQIWSNEAGWKQKQLGWNAGAETSPISNKISGENQKNVGVVLFHAILYADIFRGFFSEKVHSKNQKFPLILCFF